MSSEQSPTYDARLVKAFGVALAKARELGYPVERMQITLSTSGNVCAVYFELIPEPGHAVLGGDLTVNVDFDKATIIDYERGQ